MTDIPSIKDANTLGDVLAHHSRHRPLRVATSYQGRDTTFADLYRHSCQVANGLAAAGVGVATRVALLDKNSDLYFEAALGIALAGATIVTVNWRLAAPEVEYILADSDSEILFVGRDYLPLVDSIKDSLAKLKQIIVLDGGADSPASYCPWRNRQEAGAPGVQVGRSDIAIQLYTSGTTGHPKGVELSHGCFLQFRDTVRDDLKWWTEWHDDDVSLMAMPGFHIGGIGWLFAALYNGQKTVILPEFEPTAALEAMAEHRVTRLCLVPAAIRALLLAPGIDRYDLSSIKYLIYGASPIPLDLLKQALTTLKCQCAQLYGMTETTGGATYLSPDNHSTTPTERMRSAGCALPGVELKIIDDKGDPLPPRHIGEICIKSPANMTAYWKLEEATRNTLVDGYVHSGDAGYLDEDGFLYVQDRVKDMIISGGENIYPAELESALFGHPAIADIAIIGVPDDKWGEAVKAMVVLKDGHQMTEEAFITYAKGRIASYKCPKSVAFIPQLPRNAAGKILKRELRAPYWEGRERAVN